MRTGIWKISDPFFRFWFRYVFPNRSRLERARISEVAEEIASDLPTFVGPIFEDCCREWVGRFSPLGAGALEVGSWWSRRHDVEIDVVALDKRGYGRLGSCKWSTRAVGEDVLDQPYAARAALGPKSAQSTLGRLTVDPARPWLATGGLSAQERVRRTSLTRAPSLRRSAGNRSKPDRS